jgi:predicted fused transcriptional regulator/phosphomethylpyrimidine kinase
VLEDNSSFPKLIPEVGCNIGMALPKASSYDDIAAVEGRIVWHKGRAVPVGCVDFGASQHVAGVILTLLRYNSEIRAAINIKHSEETLAACREMRLEISSFDRAGETENASNADLGTTEAIKKYGSVPRVIYDEGSPGEEPMIFLLGASAIEIAKLAVELAEIIQ